MALEFGITYLQKISVDVLYANLYVNLFNLISFTTFINLALQPECIILKFNSCLQFDHLVFIVQLMANHPLKP